MGNAKSRAMDSVYLRDMQTDRVSAGQGGEFPGDNGYLLVERENDEGE